MLRVGQFVILVMPGELTTMAGRRMRWVSSERNVLGVNQVDVVSFFL
jgi:hypothetical protein